MEFVMEIVGLLWQNIISTSENTEIQNEIYCKLETDNNLVSEFNSNTVVNPQICNKISSEEN
jgi:hypothetical protein